MNMWFEANIYLKRDLSSSEEWIHAWAYMALQDAVHAYTHAISLQVQHATWETLSEDSEKT